MRPSIDSSPNVQGDLFSRPRRPQRPHPAQRANLFTTSAYQAGHAEILSSHPARDQA
jgi:hypothetical protein